MRAGEIKFRVWNGTEMLYSDIQGWSEFGDCWMDNENLMQFVGFKDKNKVDIYVGDKLKTRHGSVKTVDDLESFYIWCYQNSMAFTTIEVIGNIHEK